MLTVLVSSISIVIVVATAIVLYRQNEKLKIDTRDKMQGLVDQINDAQYYEYKFDQKQDQNIKNIDKNVQSVHSNLVKLQNNVKYLEDNALLNDTLKQTLQTNNINANDINTKKLSIANGTKNNIVIESGTTSDGANQGWSAINFNGFFKDGEKLIDPSKSRWRLVSDQRGASDSLSFDQLNKDTNVVSNYVWMSDGTVGLNNNKLRFSNRWTGFPDNAKDQAEISNDAAGFQKLMIVGNKSSGEGIRKVGIWDRLDVHGDQGVDRMMSAQNVQGRDAVFAGNWNAYMRKDGYMWTQGWVDGAGVKARSQLCVDDVCINKGDLNALKQGTQTIQNLQSQVQSLQQQLQQQRVGIVTFRQTFTTGAINQWNSAWINFCNQLTGNYSRLTIKGSYDSNGKTTTDRTIVNGIAAALRNAGNYSARDNNTGITWSVGSCGDTRALAAQNNVCSCDSPGYVVRPLIGNQNWGGVGTATCNGPTQEIIVEFQ